MVKKVILWAVAIILVGAVVFLGVNACDGEALKSELSAKQDSLTEAKQSANNFQSSLAENQDSLAAAKFLADSLQKAYNKCAGVMTPEEELAFLKSKVSDLQKRKPIVKYRYICCKSAAKSKAKPDVAEKKFEPTFSPKPVSRVVEIRAVTPTENNLVTQYQGVMTGDYGTTIDNGSGKIVYFLRNSFVKSNGGGEAPRLNGRGGEKFSYNPKTGYWYYIDGQVMTAGEVNSWTYAREWNVYIGQTDYGVGSYETYLPHQALKPLINRVRGKEWGEISDEDLINMRKLNSSIWTPSSEGTLRPFRLNGTSGRALGKEDRQLYQGWNFRTRIVVVSIK